MQALPKESTIAVVGSGAMGSGIAQVAASAGHQVLLYDTRVDAADKASPAGRGSRFPGVVRGPVDLQNLT